MNALKQTILEATGSVIRGRTVQLHRRSVRTKRYLNVGSGSAVPKGFINLDYQFSPRLDVCWDITTGVPLPDRSIEGVFTEHTLEHLPYDKVRFVLQEFRRVLAPGGALRIAVPDAELYISAYERGKARRGGTFPTGAPASGLSPSGETPMMAVCRIFSGHGHLSAYDYETMAHLLDGAGFADIRRETFRSGRDPVLLIDKERRRAESLYVEATAP